jgi:hypothetical protein
VVALYAADYQIEILSTIFLIKRHLRLVVILPNPADTGVEVDCCRQDSASNSKLDLDECDIPTYR